MADVGERKHSNDDDGKHAGNRRGAAGAPRIVKRGPAFPVIVDVSRNDRKGALFRRKHFFMIITGSSGSGKTNAVVALLLKPYRKKFDQILFMTPGGNHDDKVDKLKLPDDRFMDMDQLESVVATIEQSGKRRSLIVIDDATGSLSSAPTDMLANLTTRTHHLKTSIIIVTHSLGASTPSLFKRCWHVLCLTCVTERDIMGLQPYLKGGLDVDTVRRAYQYSQKSPRRPLFITEDGVTLVGFDQMEF